MYTEEDTQHFMRLVRRFATNTRLSNLALSKVLHVSHATSRRWLSGEYGQRVYDNTATEVLAIIAQADALDAKTKLYKKLSDMPMRQRAAALTEALSTPVEPVSPTETSC